MEYFVIIVVLLIIVYNAIKDKWDKKVLEEQDEQRKE